MQNTYLKYRFPVSEEENNYYDPIYLIKALNKEIYWTSMAKQYMLFVINTV